LDVSQAIICKRLLKIQKNLRLLAQAPSLDPLEVGENLRNLLNEELAELAFFGFGRGRVSE